jgi:SET domain-containing protein
MKKLWFKKISSLHGSGLFAEFHIKKNEKIIEYVGDKISKKEGDKRANKQIKKAQKNKKKGMVYIFELDKKYDIDGGIIRNYARFINHSCDPNCEVEITDNQIWISSIKRIKKGAELTYNYGYPFDTDFEDHICKCGSKKCAGYILSHDDWPKLKRALNKKNNF